MVNPIKKITYRKIVLNPWKFVDFLDKSYSEIVYFKRIEQKYLNSKSYLKKLLRALTQEI